MISTSLVKRLATGLRRGIERGRLRGGFGAMIVISLTGCSASTAVSHTPAKAGPRAVAGQSCPVPAPSRSSPGRSNAVAPGDPTATTICIYELGRRRALDRQVLGGGPLDGALNSSLSRFPPRSACAGTATLPTVILLRYRAAPPRHVVVDIGGCSLITSHGSSRVLLGRALGELLARYER